jgi:hypothetical protein
MVSYDTFNNISAISWRSVALVEETALPGENHRPAASHWQTLSHNVLSSTPHLTIYNYWASKIVNTRVDSLMFTSYDSCIYNYLCNQCLSPLTLRVRIPVRWGVLDKTLCDKVCQWLAAGRWFSPGNAVSSTNATDRHDIAEILLVLTIFDVQ